MEYALKCKIDAPMYFRTKHGFVGRRLLNYCSECGQKVCANDRFCRKCGLKFKKF